MLLYAVLFFRQQTEYLTRLRSWLPEPITKNSAEAIEAVSYRLYRRLSSAPHDGKFRLTENNTFEFESAEDSFSEPMDDAELALLRPSFADIQGLCSSFTTEEEMDGEAQEKSVSLLPSTSWPFTTHDTVVQRGLEWLRRSPKVSPDNLITLRTIYAYLSYWF
ncbi:unnamed protein product [Echinostoma caproni]|uniref:Uncharacterized protein n=1 Tax=Echinostoma caproni TaxID=27848 RepID=A0A183ATJ4_9TREM|nr:unnamed protein product [Echinostoma caproni]